MTLLGTAFAIGTGACFYGFYHIADPIMRKYDGDLEGNEHRMLIDEKIDLACSGLFALLGTISFACAVIDALK